MIQDSKIFNKSILFVLIFLTFMIFEIFFINQVFAGPNIVNDGASCLGTNTYCRWAWNDIVGWIDFDFIGTENVEVKNDKISGYGSAQIGFIALDCATTPNPPTPTCVGPAGDWKVKNDSTGKLSGWAWNENIGWISFCGNESGGSDGTTMNCPSNQSSATYPYQVTISTSGANAGEFQGWAWNDVVGWISFNCDNDHDLNQSGIQKICTASDLTSWTSPPATAINYRVKTAAGTANRSAELTSSILGPAGDGWTLNSILWKGQLNSTTGFTNVVQFQFAVNSPAGDGTCATTASWNFFGSDGTSATYFTGDPDQLIQLSRLNNIPCFRYKIKLISNNFQSPQVDNVIINYSP